MANRQRAEARRKAAAKAARSEGGGSRTWLWVTLGAVAVAAIVVGVVVLNNDDGSSAGGDTTVPGSEVQSDIPDSQPVTITGAPLAPFEAGTDSTVGTAAPVLEGLDFQGDPITVDGATNGPTMVVFLAHWCPHCNAEVPRLLDWKNSGQVPPGLNVVGVATAVSSQAVNYPPGQWFSDKGWSWPVLVDEKLDDNASAGKAAQAFGATGWPYIVVIDANGNVTARASGEKTIEELQALVDTAL